MTNRHFKLFQKTETVSPSTSSASSSGSSSVKNYWLKKDIVVKIITKSLGDKYVDSFKFASEDDARSQLKKLLG